MPDVKHDHLVAIGCEHDSINMLSAPIKEMPYLKGKRRILRGHPFKFQLHIGTDLSSAGEAGGVNNPERSETFRDRRWR